MPKPLLKVQDLRTSYFLREGELKAVDGVSFNIGSGEILGLVGESGCGKSVTALSTLRLVPYPPGRIVGGRIYFEFSTISRIGFMSRDEAFPFEFSITTNGYNSSSERLIYPAREEIPNNVPVL